MYNMTSLKTNAELWIDGKKMGKWRIEPKSDIVVERPEYNNRKFTFVKETSWEGAMGKLKINDFENGLIEVKFIPEHNFNLVGYNKSIRSNIMSNDSSVKFGNMYSAYDLSNGPHRQMRNFSSDNSSQSQSLSGGGTILGDDSFQKFRKADYINEDVHNTVIKRVRLVVNNNIKKPYAPLEEQRYMWRRDGRIPPRINYSN